MINRGEGRKVGKVQMERQKRREKGKEKRKEKANEKKQAIKTKEIETATSGQLP